MRNLISFQFNSNQYNPMHYRTRLMGTSDCNMFVPFYSLFAHELVEFEESGVRLIEYSLPGDANPNTYVRQYAHLLNTISTTGQPIRYNYKLRGRDMYVNLHRGIIYKGDIVYVCLGINSEYIINTPISEIESNPDITKFTLFINNAFDTTTELKNIRKKVGEMYIDPLKNLGMDVVQTSRINEWLFQNNYEEPKFKNVTQLMKHLQEDVPKMLQIQ
jgi:hypothetical protein